MKKSLALIFVFLLLFNIIITQLLKAEMPSVTPSVPGLGKINEESGLPESFEKFKQIANNLSEDESRKQYLTQEWTKLYANGKLSPVLYYTTEFFSFFNPVWELIFKIPFSWSWEFLFSLLIFIILIVVLYAPSKHLTNLNPVLTAVFSVVIACLVGAAGTIQKAVEQMVFAVTNIWIAVYAMAFAILFTVLYALIMKKLGINLKEKVKKEELEKAEEMIKLHGKVSEEELKGNR
jgi:hypothetical protein